MDPRFKSEGSPPIKLEDIPSTSTSPPPSPAASTSPSPAPVTFRDVCLRIIHKRFPEFAPRNDFDIFTLGTTEYDGADAHVLRWLDHKLAEAIAYFGSHAAAMGSVQSVLDQPSSHEITGQKPGTDGRDPRVIVRPIPGNEEYSLRLFPGALVTREYCMDFVHSSTGEPVNSPFTFELWHKPVTPKTCPAWLRGEHGQWPLQLTSLENAFGIPQEDILPGMEKFVLREGETCLLKRSGHRDVQFTVPIRDDYLKDEDVAHHNDPDDDVDVLDIPATV